MSVVKVLGMTKIKGLYFDNVIIGAMIVFFVLSTIFGFFLFRQFSGIDVVNVSLVFFLLFVVMVVSFSKIKVDLKKYLSLINVVSAFFLSILFFYYIGGGSHWFHEYYPMYPTLQVDIGLSVLRDSLYHISLIQSILNFGYPSIAQHDLPVTGYHVLSHYIDASILKITGLDPFGSYGLLYYFKNVFLILSFAYFLYLMSDHKSLILYFISFVALFHFAGGSRHMIGSHGLWFASFLFILSFHKVYALLNKEKITRLDYFFVFSLVVFISLGKVSSGFVYAMFLGFYFLIKDVKDYRVYIVGVAWCAFFWVYMHSMSDYTEGSSLFPTPERIHELMSHEKIRVLYPYLSVLFLLSMSIFKKAVFRYLLASLLTFFGLIFVLSTNPDFSGSDIAYFRYGLLYILVFIIFSVILDKNSYLNMNIAGLTRKIGVASIAIYISIISFDSFVNSLGAKKYSFFDYFNERLKEEDKLSITRLYEDSSAISEIREKYVDNRYQINSFKSELYEYIASNGFERESLLLYVPKEAYEDYFSGFKVSNEFLGVFIYSVTGVPLLHGVRNPRRTYGYSDYDDNAFWREKDDFDKVKACRFDKDIVILNGWSPFEFKYIKCA